MKKRDSNREFPSRFLKSGLTPLRVVDPALERPLRHEFAHFAESAVLLLFRISISCADASTVYMGPYRKVVLTMALFPLSCHWQLRGPPDRPCLILMLQLCVGLVRHLPIWRSSHNGMFFQLSPDAVLRFLFAQNNGRNTNYCPFRQLVSPCVASFGFLLLRVLYSDFATRRLLRVSETSDRWRRTKPKVDRLCTSQGLKTSVLLSGP